jgi:LDH2 family malate/lactate/ureidoglycolate dehydrogenase
MFVTIDSRLLQQFTARVFQACGAPDAEAAIIADHLVTANLMGYDTHGVIRIPQYLDDIQNGTIGRSDYYSPRYGDHGGGGLRLELWPGRRPALHGHCGR